MSWLAMVGAREALGGKVGRAGKPVAAAVGLAYRAAMYLRQRLLFLLCALTLSACSLLQMNRSLVISKYKHAGLGAHDVELSVGKMHYYDGGQGSPIVLIHGFAFGALETWEKQVPTFIKSHRVIVPDLFWFGDSVPSGAMDDAEQQARALSELLGRLGIERADIVGISFGGYVALRLALTHPEQVTKLVLADAAGLTPTAQETHGVEANFPGKQHLAELMIPQDTDDLKRFLKTVMYKPRYIPKCVLREILFKEFWKNREAKRQMCNHMEAAGGFLMPDDLKPLLTPTLLIWGRHDPLILPSLGARLAAAIAKAQILYFEHSNHSPMLEEPKRFNAEVLGFLGR